MNSLQYYVIGLNSIPLFTKNPGILAVSRYINNVCMSVARQCYVITLVLMYSYNVHQAGCLSSSQVCQ